MSACYRAWFNSFPTGPPLQDDFLVLGDAPGRRVPIRDAEHWARLTTHGISLDTLAQVYEADEEIVARSVDITKIGWISRYFETPEIWSCVEFQNRSFRVDVEKF